MKSIATTVMAGALVLVLPGLVHAVAQDQQPPARASQADQRDSTQPVGDAWITTKVKADLLASANVPGSDIQVETVDGVVTLSGTVATQAEKDKAVEAASRIEGVTRVEAGNLKVGSR